MLTPLETAELEVSEARRFVDAMILLQEDTAPEQPQRVWHIMIPMLYAVADKLKAAAAGMDSFNPSKGARA